MCRFKPAIKCKRSIMALLLLLLSLALASQVRSNGENITEYCNALLYWNMTNPQCSQECQPDNCFGRGADQCYACSDPYAGIQINISQLCEMDLTLLLMNFTVWNCTMSTGPVLTKAAIIGIGVGGGVVILFLCLLFICCCCCCIRRKRYKMFQPQIITDEVDSPVKPDGKFQPIANDLDKSLNQTNEFEMQINMALLDDSVNSKEVGLSPPNTSSTSGPHQPTTSAVKKSSSSYEIRETNIDNYTGAATPPPSSLKDKGYVQMSSAGSVQLSLSCGNLNQEDIYSDPDVDAQTTHLILPSPAKPNPKKFTKPATLPKPAALAVAVNVTNSSSSSPSNLPNHPPPSKKGETSEAAAPKRPQSAADDDYESPDIFRQDLNQQKIENYYNKDALLKIPGMDLQSSGANGDQTVYENMALPVTSIDNESDEEEDDERSYEDLRNFVSSGKENPDGMYYNVTEVLNIDEDRESEEDDMYVYMKSGQALAEQKETTANQERVVVKDRKRLESEPLGKSKKYINVSREQQYLTETAQQERRSTEGNKHKLQDGGPVTVLDKPVKSELHHDVEGPVYANFNEDEHEEEELYTELT